MLTHGRMDRAFVLLVAIQAQEEVPRELGIGLFLSARGVEEGMPGAREEGLVALAVGHCVCSDFGFIRTRYQAVLG